MTKFKAGEQYICTNAASCGYRKDEVYDCIIEDKTGSLALIARDGFTDLCNMLVSNFKPIKRM